MTDVQTRTLGGLIEGVAGTSGLAVTIDGEYLVVLGRTESGTVEVYRPGEIVSHPLWTMAGPVIAPDVQADLLAGAVRHLDTARREHRQALERIREYAVDKHRDGGEICREGLNAFLREFDLPEYEPQLRVDYTIRGSYEVDTTDENSARAGAKDRLGVDLGDVSDVIDDTTTHTAEVTEIQRLDHAEHAPRLRVDYTIRGSYEVDTTDEDSARAGAEDWLGVDPTIVAEVIDGTTNHTVEVTDIQAVGH